MGGVNVYRVISAPERVNGTQASLLTEKLKLAHIARCSVSTSFIKGTPVGLRPDLYGERTTVPIEIQSRWCERITPRTDRAAS
jgi:hypothetical protein